MDSLAPIATFALAPVGVRMKSVKPIINLLPIKLCSKPIGKPISEEAAKAYIFRLYCR